MKRVLSLSFSIIVAGLVLAYFQNKPDFELDTSEFGKSFNTVRGQIGIPLIEASWVAHNSDSLGVTWMNKSHSLETKEAHHFAKDVKIKKGKVISEEDSFNKFVNDSVDHRVIYVYNYETKEWNCKLSIRYYRTYPPSEVKQLRVEQADSIINSWGLRRH